MTDPCPTGDRWKESEDFCIFDFPADTQPRCDTTGACLDADSIRSTAFVDDEGFRHVLRLGCPTGEWDHDAESCNVPTVPTQMLHPKAEPRADMLDKTDET